MFAFLGVGVAELVVLGLVAVLGLGGVVVLFVVLKVAKGSTGAGDEVRHLRIEVDRLREENDKLREELNRAHEKSGASADTGIN